MIIKRYLAKEVYSTLTATTIVLMLIFMSNEIVRYSRGTASGQLSWHLFSLFIFACLPHLLALLLPLSLFVAILLAYGRMNTDNEMTILSVSGVSQKYILQTTLKFSAAIIFIVAILALFIDPKVSSYSDQIIAGNASTALDFLTPNKFQQASYDNWVIYVDKVSSDKTKLSNIFVAENPRLDDEGNMLQTGVVFAQSGQQQKDKKTTGNYLVLNNGFRYEVTPGKKYMRTIKYKDYGIKLQQKITSYQSDVSDENTFTLLKHIKHLSSLTELQWRLSLPLTALILTALAVGLSKQKPRKGRYAKLIPGAICYISYVQLLVLSRSWLEKGIISPWIGLWWVHIIFVFLTLFLLVNKKLIHYTKFFKFINT